MKNILLLLIIGFSFSCKPKQSLTEINPSLYRVAFYNVENLFDTIDDPKTIDEEFTPISKKQWTEERYMEKLNHLTKVVAGMEFPALIGVSEVENSTVLKDWCEKTELSKYDYGFVHFDSPDLRGIDNGFLYQKKAFKVEKSDYLRINFPKEVVEDYTTRDVLMIEGKLNNLPLHIFVNHWPSRRGGVKESEPKRMYVAQQVREKIDEILKENSKANILLMGDFNDEPNNNSITKGLNVQYGAVREKVTTDFINCMAELDEQGKGTYNYRGNWNMLDQIIVSNHLYSGRTGWLVVNPTIFQRDWMMYTDSKYKQQRPSRTYGGPRYFGGYSDHLPVYVELKNLYK